MNSHPQSFMSIDELGTRIPPYYPTYDFPQPFIDKAHSDIADCPLKDGILIQIRNSLRGDGEIIEGWLQRADALKLYEMSFFAGQDILELGSYHGLSTTIIAQASRNSPTSKHVYSIDLDPTCARATKGNLEAMGLLSGVTILCADAVAAVRELRAGRRQFGFIFVDHHHSYTPVYEVCLELAYITAPGGFCLFHDFNDPRNADPDNKDFGVYQAVMDGLDRERFEFYGIYGCAALYRLAR